VGVVRAVALVAITKIVPLRRDPGDRIKETDRWSQYGVMRSLAEASTCGMFVRRLR
jgi:hypothetical protein